MSVAPPAPAAPPEYPEKIDAAVLKIAGVVVLGAIMSILDITVVNVALRTLQEDFATDGVPLDYSTVAWTVTGYTLALATVIPLTGWAADRFGTKRLYMLAVSLFTLGSVLCATAGSIETLVAYRVLQGLGGGMLMPLGMTIMTRAAGPKRMGRLMAVLGIPMLLGPIFGPILGGWLIDHFSWHWIFLINLPIGILALGYAFFALPADRPTPSETLDWRGVLLMSPGLALFLYGVSSIPGEGGIGHTKVLLPGLVGLVLIVAFVAYSFRPQHPLLDFRLFRNRNLTVAVITMFIFAASFFGGLLLIPQFLQQVQGETPLAAGWLVAPQGLGAMVTMPIAGALVDRFPVGRIVPFGLLLITGGMYALTQIEADSSHWGFLIPVLFVMGLGMGATMMPIMTSALKTLTHHEVARGTTLLNITQQIASSVGVATFSVLLTNAFKDRPLVGQSAQFFETAQTEGADAAQALLAKLPLVGQFLTEQGGNTEALAARVAELSAQAYAHTFWFAAGLVTLTLVSAAFLPRQHEESHLLDDEDGDEVAPPAMLH
ncbi:DHA2 family efflux MFS transporter permease subunit [Phycicoccus endophyticus]|uniref:DHA2 family efflux MFS transporter permease subunit n=1 Tax=Phycicoccus endophyticus TaxID=1690220 RepID=A0A7G9R2M1_9MICO|nr:DHA2 family efflux MFS transporter permease subunit [Phycicoccus endophyticus]NHI20691.1 DHA2 family efflux MFS transporter permease subunit [Phycicoccus endophyticus]QNN49846.1 DHA2 family efflux MFS transporter permease subunit [Phycicoccus endophyticus]GGL35702.1 multidrug resistance protein B [Phycicoccus endophyticus]